MLIDEVMTRYPACVRRGTIVRRAAELLTASDIGMLMVLDDRDGFVGVLTEADLLGAVLPDAEEIRAAGNSLDDAFSEFVRKGRTVADRPVDDLVTRDPVTVARGVEVAAAAVVLLDRRLSRLPVLDGRTVVGSVSRADLCRAVLAHAPGGSGDGAADRTSATTDGKAAGAPGAADAVASRAAAARAAAGSGTRQTGAAAGSRTRQAGTPAGSGIRPAGTASPRSGAAPAAAGRPGSAQPGVAGRGTRVPAAARTPDAAAAQAAARLAQARARAARPGPAAGVSRG